MKIKFEEKYIEMTVNGKKAVKCILTAKNHYDTSFIVDLLRMILKSTDPSYTNKKLIDKFDVKREFSAIAVCHPDDEYSLSLGKKIARDKAYSKVDKYLQKLANYIFDTSIDIAYGVCIERGKGKPIIVPDIISDENE